MAITNKYEINGVIDTSDTVLNNINTLANAAGAFVTWDPSAGTWSVIKNNISTSVASFDDTNIIGNINVSGSGINDMYNAVTIEFPHQDLKDTRDYIDLEIPAEDRYQQELDNKLEIRMECINNPVQAQLIASRELKQSRVDKIIEFSSSYLGNGLSAGDLIDVTSSMYGYTNKVFRILTIEEEDTDDGSIVFRFQALEYDEDVYSTDGLVRKERNKKTGIVPKGANLPLYVEDGQDTMNGLAAALLLGAGNAIANLLAGLSYRGFQRTYTTEDQITVAEFNSFMTTLGTPTSGNVWPNYSNYYPVLGGDYTTTPWVVEFTLPASAVQTVITFAVPQGTCKIPGSTTFNNDSYPIPLHLYAIVHSPLVDGGEPVFAGTHYTNSTFNIPFANLRAGTHRLYLMPYPYIDMYDGKIVAPYDFSLLTQADDAAALSIFVISQLNDE